MVRRKTRNLNPAQQLLDIRHTWTVTGKLQADTPAGIITAKAALEAAYAKQFQDAVLYLDNGTTVHDSLRNRGSTTGVKVIAGPDYPASQGAEGVTYLSYSVTLEAAYEFSATHGVDGGGGSQGSDPQRLESWTETQTLSGGGPRYAVIEVVNGPAVRQLVNAQTKMRLVQSGSAVGRKFYPIPPGPAAPDWENPAERSITKTSPTGAGQLMTGYTTNWTYVMEGPAIDGATVPNDWPI